MCATKLRHSQRGDWHVGYLPDIIVDADSGLMTQLRVLPAVGKEAAVAIKLIRRDNMRNAAGRQLTFHEKY